MKEISNRYQFAGKILLVFLLGSLANTTTLRAQTNIWDYLAQWYSSRDITDSKESQLTLTLQENETMVQVPYTGNYIEFKLPDTVNSKYLAVTVRGGDGGSRINTALVTPFKTNGGGAAIVEGLIPIGTGTNEIPPGALLRFIVGKGGHKITSGGTVGGDGGAGTGLFVKKPGETNWHILMVAGGGGGAYSDCCAIHAEGRSASTTTSGGKGGGDSDGGTQGRSGSDGCCAAGGQGLYSERPCIQNGVPVGSTGIFYGTFETRREQFGCGGGGPANDQGGGGGGYSGGGAGAGSEAGGGGGSYCNPDWVKQGSIKQSPKTLDPQNGYINFYFLKTNQIKLAADDSKCIDDHGAGTANGNNIQLYHCKDQPDQQWLTKGSTIRLSNELDKCIDLSNGNTANGTNIQLWDCVADNKNQVWIYDVAYQSIRSGVDFNKCIDLTKSNTADETNIQLWDCNNTGAQKWLIDGIPTSMPTVFYNIIRVDRYPNKCIDISKSGTANGTNIQLFDCNGTNAQYFTFDGRAIKMQSTPNKCIDLNQSQTNDGANIQLFDCNGTKAQQWIYDGFAGAFRSAIDPSKCLDVDNSNFSNGANIQLWSCNGTNAQRFAIEQDPNDLCSKDVTPPVAKCKDFQNTANVVPTAAMVDNGSYDNCSISSMHLESTGFHKYKLTVTDPSGNTSSCTATVN